MFEFIKKILIKKWSREIIREIKNHLPRSQSTDCKNLAGLGGQQFKPYIVLWSDLAMQSRDPEIKFYRHDSLAAKETLFFEYFAPFESWCDNNCQGGYYLWTDKIGVCRVFTDNRDEFLYRLVFSKNMPTMNEIYDIIVDP